MRFQIIVLGLLQAFLLVLSDQDVKHRELQLPAGGNISMNVTNSMTNPANVTQAIISKDKPSQMVGHSKNPVLIEFDPTTTAPSTPSNSSTTIAPSTPSNSSTTIAPSTPSNSSTTTPLPIPTNAATITPPTSTSTTTLTPPSASTTTTTTPQNITTISPVNLTSNSPTSGSTTQPTLGPTTAKTENSSLLPPQSRQFDGPSFIGGIVLTVGLTAIAFIAFKFYKADRVAKAENYRQL